MLDLGGPVRRLWNAAGLCNRSFGHSGVLYRISTSAVLITASRRVELRQAVATLNSGDALSIVAWGAWLVTTLVALLATLLLVAVAPVAVVLVPVVLCLYVLAVAGVVQRVTAWRRSRGLVRALHLTNVAAEPARHGHGTALLAEIIDIANSAGRPITLTVNVANDRAIALYRRSGFQETGRTRRRLHMSRPSDSPAPALDSAPAWSAPIPLTAGVIIGAASGTAVGAILTIAYWSTPAAWLMLPAGAVAGTAGACASSFPGRMSS